jgi:CRP-like cAMP-binding protein
MALDLIADCLQRHDAFRGLAHEQIERIAREAERLIFRNGQKLLEAGCDGDGAILIISGYAVTLADPELDVDAYEIEAGAMLGEAAMLSEHQFRVTVVAAGDVKAVRINRATLLAHMQEDPTLAEHFYNRVASRLQRLAVELRLIDERLAAVSQPAPATATG